ncbi:Na(+)-translocating NADH-quinone reductase subunit C [Mangrovicoccus sp. HB161399]|uniref:Na(+)-translocating NADH-quinone reductase subunit C n=1 Tax=Mangrovicoccus sp. HB161399 TaxID=2720392 RepID=UPI00155757BA|nr:Na(+)-translocating NADH-quinone reductase subunit C [Mangrovicoccus sp. HB161399]
MPETKKGFLGWWQNTPADSTAKTLFVAITLCLFCSMVVAAAAVALRPIQEANQLLDKRRNILEVAGLYEPGMDINEVFTSAFEPKIVDLQTGDYVDEVPNAAGAPFTVATYDDVAATSDMALSSELENDPAGLGRQARYQMVYLLKDDSGALDKVVLPISGYGLWSTLYGFITLEEDTNTIFGLQFYQQAETPGLGAEVDNPRWKALWNGKELRNSEGDLAINVSKGSPSGEAANYHIDALAGATLTSRGVDNLVRFWMGEQGFAPYLEKLKNGDL